MAAAQEPHINGVLHPPNSETTNFTSKRQRRPSVRLVEITDQPSSSLTKHSKPLNKPSKTRPLTNLAGFDQEKREKGDLNLDNLAIGSWRNKGFDAKRDVKRPRTNWGSRNFDSEDGFSRDFQMEEGSESPIPLQNSFENDKDLQLRAPNSVRDDGVGLDDDNGGHSERGWGGEVDGVRVWLNELGLGRYWPVFEFHEVDEEVLPMLTLDDLKDMGISAVGSRRKMFCAIQKLNKDFS